MISLRKIPKTSDHSHCRLSEDRKENSRPNEEESVLLLRASSDPTHEITNEPDGEAEESSQEGREEKLVRYLLRLLVT